MSKIIDLTGKRFGNLVIVERAPTHRTPSGRTHTMWKARCDCGTTKPVRSSSVIHEGVTSCGCIRKVAGNRNSRWKGHGEIGGHYWATLKQGARLRNYEFTITIDYAWKLFEQQGRICALSGQSIKFATLWRAKDQTASLDRIDGKAGYVPGNVQWVHKDINKMKHNFSEQRFVELCEMVAKHCACRIKDYCLRLSL